MYVHTKLRTQTDAAALFVAAKNGTRPGQPSGVNAEANSPVRTTHGTAASKGQQEGRAARGTRVRLRGGSQVTFCSPSRNDRDTDTDPGVVAAGVRRGRGQWARLHPPQQRATPRGDGLFCILTVPTPESWRRSWSMTSGRNWVKGVGDLSVSFLTVACESVMISKRKA